MITIIHFSGREHGNCGAAAHIIKDVHQKDHVKQIHMKDVSISPCGSCDYECLNSTSPCPVDDDVNGIYASIVTSDLVYFIVPNYCDYPSAYFFMFNERGCGYYNQDETKVKQYAEVPKKFIVISNSNQAHFNDIFSYHTDKEKPDSLFMRSNEYGKRSLDGDLFEDKRARETLMTFISQ